MNRANGMIILDEDEEEAWEAQLRIGIGIRSGPKASENTDERLIVCEHERLSDENDVFDDMGSGPNMRTNMMRTSCAHPVAGYGRERLAPAFAELN